MRSTLSRSIYAVFALAFAQCGSTDENANNASDAQSPVISPDASLSETSYPDAFDRSDAQPLIGQPGCGLPVAAFCDTFDAPSTNRGRAGDLDSVFWSAGRMQVQGPTAIGRAFGIGMAVIPSCRAGIANHVWPESDTLVCDSNSDLASSHLLVGAAAQNYGQNDYRIRQPFDFASRTGTIVFDGTVSPLGGLFGWLSLSITEDPIANPGFTIYVNDEGDILPKNAIEIQFGGAQNGGVTVGGLHVFKDYADTIFVPDDAVIPATYQPNKLNHYEVLISEQQIEVHISPFSTDGKTFAAPQFIFSVSAALPFSRGYLHLAVHNHATLKYSGPYPDGGSKGFGQDSAIDATVARIDNMGFDGPVVANWREYEMADSLTSFKGPVNTVSAPDPYNTDQTGYNVGYVVNDQSLGPLQTLHFAGVDLTDVTTAELALSSWYLYSGGGTISDYDLLFRVNGKAWHDRKLTPAEIALFTPGPVTVDSTGKPEGTPAIQGALGQVIDVPLTDLQTGDNTLELVTSNIPTNYPPGVANVDLVLTTK